MRTVIKLAGALLEDTASLRPLARQIAALAKEGHEILVVHGGGRVFTATLKRMGIESKFLAGLRVTDSETRDVAVMVFAGLLNKRLAAAISAEGQPAVGISAADARCFLAEPVVHGGSEGSLGFVGYLTGLNGALIASLWREIYNINADHMAAACAEYLGAERLIYLTDVAGVLDGERVLSAISLSEIEPLVQSRVVSGGMVLKLEAAKRALEGGVREVRIVGGASGDSLLRAAHVSETPCDEDLDAVPGTRILSSAQAAISVAR
jgi:acetylglutamate kinase